MKNRRIEYADKYSIIRLFVVLIVFIFMPTLVFGIIEKNYYLVIIFFIIILFNVFGIFWATKYNIIFDYKKQVITVLEPFHYYKIKVPMREIKYIQLIELKSEKRKRSLMDFFLEYRLRHQPSEKYVYNFGKKYQLQITKTNGCITVIPYNSLYRCKDTKTIEKFENEVNQILKEFKEYRYPPKK